MNQREAVYRLLILRQRRRWAETGRKWPGKPEAALAESRYPNLLAELDASGKTLEDLAKLTRVSPEVLAGVLESCEELKPRELNRAAYHLKAGEDYLTSPVLRLVCPETRRGGDFLRWLVDATQAAGSVPPERMARIRRVRERLEHGKPVTYADYRWVCRWLKEAAGKKNARGKQVRTERIQGGS